MNLSIPKCNHSQIYKRDSGVTGLLGKSRKCPEFFELPSKLFNWNIWNLILTSNLLHLYKMFFRQEKLLNTSLLQVYEDVIYLYLNYTGCL